jgi:hypothetical protein
LFSQAPRSLFAVQRDERVAPMSWFAPAIVGNIGLLSNLNRNLVPCFPKHCSERSAPRFHRVLARQPGVDVRDCLAVGVTDDVAAGGSCRRSAGELVGCRAQVAVASLPRDIGLLYAGGAPYPGWMAPKHPQPRPRSAAGPPMTLGNMRSLGVRSIAITCELCHHAAVLSVEPWPDDVPVPTFEPRMVCTRCGIRARG